MSSASFAMRRPTLVGIFFGILAVIGSGAWMLHTRSGIVSGDGDGDDAHARGSALGPARTHRDASRRRSTWASLPAATRLGLERAMADSNAALAPTRVEGGLALPRAGGADVRIDAAGASIRFGARETRLSARAIGRTGGVTALRSGAPVVAGHETRLDRGAGATEWWRSLSRGVEHGFTLSSRPPGRGELRIELEFHGDLSPRLRDESIALVDSSERVVAHYGELLVIDANGRELSSSFEIDGERVRIRFDDASARYPVVVDPMVYGEEVELFASDAGTYDEFGGSVAISADGTRVVVGAAMQGDDALALDANGAAYVFVRSGTSWSEEQRLLASDESSYDYFGTSVSMSSDGTRIVVGATGDDDATGTSTVDNGAAYVFVRSGASWTEERKLVASDKASSDGFGISVSMSADGTRVVVGAHLHDDAVGTSTMDNGATYVFVRSGSSWSEEQKLLAADKADGDSFGWSVAMSADGTRLVVGADAEDDATGTNTVNNGAAYVFSRSGSVWSSEQKLLASDKASSDRFGYSVSMTSDGARLVVGADAEDDATGSSTNGNGAAYVFVRAGAVWSGEQKLLASNKADADAFGSSVSISADGSRLVVGAMGVDRPTAFTTDSGAVYVFTRSASVWSQSQQLFAAQNKTNGHIGVSVALSGDATRLITGESGFLAGSALVFGFGTPGAACAMSSDCVNGLCVDGYCCDTSCGGGATNDCVACSNFFTGVRDGICAPISSFAPTTVTCRPSAGNCDLAETCMGGNPTCPPDSFKSSSTVCRAIVDPTCDLAEYCTGSSAACPNDVVVAGGTQCRGVAGACDVPESCTGSSPSCPADAFVSNATECRAAVPGGCDVAEHCSGSAAACPADVHVSGGTTCRPVAGGCDVAEECDGSAACPADAYSGSGSVCRAATGMCDVEETCTGGGPACPANQFVSDGTSCDDGLACSATSACQLGACAAALTLDCSDGNACTTDSCAEPSGCTHTLIASCMATDAGPRTDASTPDGGGATPLEAGGCSCRVVPSAGSPFDARLLGTGLLLAFGARRLRRRARG